MRLMRLLSMSSLAILVLAAPLAAQDEADTFRLGGKIKNVSAPPKVLFANQVIAISLYDPSRFAIARPNKKGKFTFDLPSGFYAVVETRWVGPKKGYASKVRIAKLGDPSAEQLVAQASEPDGPTLSVGGIEIIGADGKPATANGKPLYADAGFIAPLVNGERKCKQHIVEDDRFGRRSDIMKEAERRSSDKIRPEDRVDLQRALDTLEAWKPQYRLTGTVTLSKGKGGLLSRILKGAPKARYTANLKVVDTATGEVLYEEQFEGDYDDMYKEIGAEVARGALDSTCKDDGISGDTWTGVLQTVSTTCIARYELEPKMQTIIGAVPLTLTSAFKFHKKGSNVTVDKAPGQDLPLGLKGTTTFSKEDGGGTMSLEGTYFIDLFELIGRAKLEFVLTHEPEFLASTRGTLTYTIDVLDGGIFKDKDMGTCQAVFQGEVLRGPFLGQ